MNLTGLILILLFAAIVLRGFRRGLVRELSGVLSIVISSLLVSALLPSVTAFLKDSTPVYDVIVYQCEATIGSKLAGSWISSLAGSSDTASAEGASYRKQTAVFSSAALTGSENADRFSSVALERSKIKSLMDQYGLDSSRLDAMSDEQVQDYIDNYFIQYLDQLGESSALGNISSALGSVSSDVLNGLTKIEQTRLIQSLPLPSSVRKTLLNFNNSQGYKKLGASTFADYLVRFCASVIMDILAFFVTMIITFLIVRSLLGMLNIAARFPILYAVNRMGGLVIGLIEGTIALWAVFLVISLFSGTSFGMTALEQINANVLLKPIYHSNAFLLIVTNAINAIL